MAAEDLLANATGNPNITRFYKGKTVLPPVAVKRLEAEPDGILLWFSFNNKVRLSRGQVEITDYQTGERRIITTRRPNE